MQCFCFPGIKKNSLKSNSTINGHKDWDTFGPGVEGSEWNVSAVVPEALFDIDEVFLGDLKAKTNRFLRIDLEGDAKGFDLILSGLVGGKPVAAVPTKAALLEEE